VLRISAVPINHGWHFAGSPDPARSAFTKIFADLSNEVVGVGLSHNLLHFQLAPFSA
jgi:hypothetical protein